MLQNVENILNGIEQELLQFHPQDPVDLDAVNSVLERATSRSATSGTDVNYLLRTLQGEQLRRQSSNQVWLIVSIVILVAVTILVLIYFKLYKFTCPYGKNCVHTPEGTHLDPHTPLTTPELRDTVLELQTPLHRDAEEIAGDQDPKQPTHFVRHGVLQSVA